MTRAHKSIAFPKWMLVEIMLVLQFLMAPLYYMPNWGGEGFMIPNNVIVWLVGFIVGSYSLYLVINAKALYLPKYYLLLTAFPVAVLLAGFITGVDEPEQWFFRLSYVWLGLLFFTSLFQYRFRQGRVDRLLLIIVLSAMIQAVIGVIQTYQPELLSGIWPASSIPYGVFQQINNQATYQVTAIVIAIFLLTRPIITHGSMWMKIVILIFFALSAFIVSYSGSRIGILSVIISFSVVILWRLKYLKKNYKLSIIAAAFLCSGSIIGSSGLLTVIDKTIALNSGLSADARLGIYAVSLDLVKEKPLFGYGLGSFERVFQYAKGEYHLKHPDNLLIEVYVSHPHNEILFWLIEGGVITVLGMIIFSIGIINSLSINKKLQRFGAISMLLPIALHTQVELPFYTSAIHWFVFLFILFSIMRINSMSVPVHISKPMVSLTKLLTVSLSVLGILFFVHTIKATYEFNMMLVEQDLWNLPTAEMNPYLSDHVNAMRMRSALMAEYAEGTNQANLAALVDWAEIQVKREPAPNMFVFLAMGYQKLGKEKEMCETLTIGSNIYPRNITLTDGLNYCKK